MKFMVGENDVMPIYASRSFLSRKSQYFEAMVRSGMRDSMQGVVVMLPEGVSRAAILKLLLYLCLDDFVLDDLDVSREYVVLATCICMLEGLRLLCGDAVQ